VEENSVQWKGRSYGGAVLPGLIKISIGVPLSLWCIALQLSKLMQADDAFGDAFIGMIAVFPVGE
jgi:hypothetical protein